jgi:hypothetical protein
MSMFVPRAQSDFPTASACTRILIGVIAASGNQEPMKTQTALAHGPHEDREDTAEAVTVLGDGFSSSSTACFNCLSSDISLFDMGNHGVSTLASV